MSFRLKILKLVLLLHRKLLKSMLRYAHFYQHGPHTLKVVRMAVDEERKKARRDTTKMDKTIKALEKQLQEEKEVRCSARVCWLTSFIGKCAE